MGEAERKENAERRRSVDWLVLIDARRRAVRWRFTRRAHGDTVEREG
jgi:hypothetical protein